jgi:DNA phosphorothioation-dependent restriction protein DptH
MNLFVKSLVSYLKNALISDNHAESRFILQSLGPDDVFDLFRSLDSFALELKKTQSVKCYFRVASKLWDEWCKKPNSENVLRQKMELYGAAGPNGELQWIDHEDKLTWYRNRTVNDEGCENLIIILVGTDHATDKGGLSDFHKVDEARIWQELNQSFVPWLETICNEQGIEASSSTLNDFDLVLKTLFELRPRQLMKLAKFIDEQLLLLGDRTLFHFDELIDLFFRELHFWGIPPLLSGSSLNSLKGKKGAEKIKAAEKFISHQGFKTASAQKKAWQKIKSNYLDSDKFVLPETVGDAPSLRWRT